MLEALLTGLTVFLALRFDRYLERIKEDEKTLAQVVREALPSEKAEVMLPMNDEEYNQYLLDLSSRGELLNKLKKPWKFLSRKSP